MGADVDLCAECEKDLPFTPCGSLEVVTETGRGKKRKYFTAACGVFYYKGRARQGILALKFHSRFKTAAVFAGYMAGLARNLTIYEGCEIIAPVPMTRCRESERGFNQAELLAEELGKILCLPVCKNLIIKTRETKKQSRINGKNKRQENVDGAYEINLKTNIINKKIMLVDDVITTGSTLNECAKMLITAGAGEVVVLCAAVSRLKIEI